MAKNDSIKHLLQITTGADYYDKGIEKFTFKSRLCHRYKEDISEKLLEGLNIFMDSMVRPKESKIHTLPEHGFDPNMPDASHGLTPVMLLAINGDTKLMDEFLTAFSGKADTQAKDRLGISALDYARYFDDKEMEGTIIKHTRADGQGTDNGSTSRIGTETHANTGKHKQAAK
ncbi:MAG: hypothetical protein FWF01_02995 [Alphaproteobacteria bacterium]|nr:hypothetical protein [Alphaproteobacteria bacterium]